MDAVMRDTEQVPETKLRSLRVDTALWEAAQAIAKRERKSLSDVMRQALIRFVRDHGGEVEDDE
jgi:predicted transcriptional regulator